MLIFSAVITRYVCTAPMIHIVSVMARRQVICFFCWFIVCRLL